MAFIIVSIIAATAATVYWYVNKHKPIKHILREAKSTMDMNGAGAAGIIDDWLLSWRNRIELPDANNKVAVVTGGARGIGKEIVRQLLKANVKVVIGVRKPELFKNVSESMDNLDRLHALKLDLESLKSVKEFADEVLKKFPKINLLINNAGIMFGDYKLTEDGIETQFAVNHLSHFYLTHLLLPALKKGGTIGEVARIVNVSSCAHFPGKIYFDDINMKDQLYDTTAAYAQSKLAQVLSTRYINKLMEEEGSLVRCFAVHPGMVNTDLFKDSALFKYFRWTMKIFFKTPTQGSISILYACFKNDLEKKGGLYISNCGEGFSNSISKNIEAQKKLHEICCDFIGIEPKLFGQGSN